jgi:amino acid permease
MAVEADINAYSEKDVHGTQDPENPKTFDLRNGETGGGHGHTQRRLRNYQVTMMGFCSGIGTGLFIGTGAAYAKAGPAGLLLAYIVVGSVLWCVMQSIGELATLVRVTHPNQTLGFANHDFSFPPLDPSLTGRPVSSTHRLASHWLFPMATYVTPLASARDEMR